MKIHKDVQIHITRGQERLYALAEVPDDDEDVEKFTFRHVSLPKRLMVVFNHYRADIIQHKGKFRVVRGTIHEYNSKYTPGKLVG